MDVMKVLLTTLLLAALAGSAVAEVIPISLVNEDDEDGEPVMWGEVVTVRGVVTVGTGVLAPNTDIYIDDGTGAVNVVQPLMASPTVAAGDSVLVKGRVSLEFGQRTSIRVDTSVTPGARIEVLNSGNPVPDPFELTVREAALGEEWEGRYAVVRDVWLSSPGEWPGTACTQDAATRLADGDTTCRIWFDADTDLCGSPEPRAPFDVYGIIIPRPRTVSAWKGHGFLPPTRAHVLSHGSGSGFVEVNPERVYAGEVVRLSFDFRGEADPLIDVEIAIPEGWTFSGNAADVTLDGSGFAGASVDALGTTPGAVVIEGSALQDGAPGTVEIAGLTAAASAGPYEFTVSTAVADGDPTGISASPTVAVGAVADPGAVLINEIMPVTDGFEIELRNPGSLDLTGWVLAHIGGSSECAIDGYWEITPETMRRSGRCAVLSIGMEPGGTPRNACPWVPLSDRVGGEEGRSERDQAYTAFLLYTDSTLAYLVDAVEFRSPVFFREDPCPGLPGLGGPDDAWTPAPIPSDYSLGRDAESTDTDNSASDLHLSSTPTIGDEVNVPFDDLPPTVRFMDDAGSWYAIVVYNEPVDPSDAENVSNYDAGDTLAFHRAWLSRDQRTVLLATDVQVPNTLYLVTISGVRDVAGNLLDEASSFFVGNAELTTPISEIQQYDENGYSPLAGQEASAVGFTTVPPGVFQADRTNMYIQDLEGWGVNVYRNAILPDPPLEGDLVKATGSITDYVSTAGAGATTEVDADNILVLARGFDLVQPRAVPTGEIGREELEGALLKGSGVVVSVEGFAFYIDDGSGAVQVYQNFSDLDFGQFAVGDSVEITGVVLQYDRTRPYFSGYELAPRYSSDMVIMETHYPGDAMVSATARVLDRAVGEEIEISYNAPRASQVTVRIYDLKGREVATLYSGMCLGQQRVTWDGRDENGSRVPSGVYVCHVQSRNRGGAGGSDAAVPVVVGTKLN